MLDFRVILLAKFCLIFDDLCCLNATDAGSRREMILMKLTVLRNQISVPGPELIHCFR